MGSVTFERVILSIFEEEDTISSFVMRRAHWQRISSSYPRETSTFESIVGKSRKVLLGSASSLSLVLIWFP